MTLNRGSWGANQGTIYLALCVVAIVVGVLMWVNAFHVGAGHKGFGVLEVTVGVLALFRGAP